MMHMEQQMCRPRHARIQAAPMGFGLSFDQPPVLFSGLSNPTSIVNCVAWYRSDLLVTQSGGTVSAWGDSSGSGDTNRNALQATGSLQPTYSASDANFNNLPSLTCALGTGRLLRTGTWSVALPQPYTVFAVARLLSAQANSYLCDSINGGLQSAVYSSSGADLRAYNGSNSNSPTFASAQTGVAIGVMDSANTASRVYWSAATPSVGVNNGTNGLTGVTLGCYAGGGTTFTDWAYAEFAYYSRALTAGEIASLNAYAAARYAITIGP